MTIYVCIEEESQHSEIWDVRVAFATFSETKAKEWAANHAPNVDRIYRAAYIDWRDM